MRLKVQKKFPVLKKFYGIQCYQTTPFSILPINNGYVSAHLCITDVDSVHCEFLGVFQEM